MASKDDLRPSHRVGAVLRLVGSESKHRVDLGCGVMSRESSAWADRIASNRNYPSLWDLIAVADVVEEVVEDWEGVEHGVTRPCPGPAVRPPVDQRRAGPVG